MLCEVAGVPKKGTFPPHGVGTQGATAETPRVNQQGGAKAMKARRLKALGFALLGGLALLFAGCGQQPGGGTGGGTGNGAVTNVGIQLPPPPVGGYSGIITVGVTVNEGARVRRIVLKVDGQEVSRIDVAGLRPQGINYTLLLDTAQLDPATNQPRFRNGTRTLTVEVTDANNNTRSASTTAIFRNQDRVRGIEVSQTDNPRAPVTRGTTQWYGNGDVFVTVDIVNYSGARYSLSGSSSPFNLQASDGQGGSLSGHRVELSLTTGTGTVTATPVSGQPRLRLARSGNSNVSATLTARVLPPSSTTPVAEKTFGLDNVAPSGTPEVQYRNIVLNYNFTNLSTAPGSPTKGTSQTLFRGTGASDGAVGVGGVTYQVAFKVSGSTVATAALPNRPSPGVTVSGLTNFVTHTVEVTAVEDALGNRQTPSATAHYFRLVDFPIRLDNVVVINTTPNAGGTFDVTFTATPSPDSGTLTPGIALNLGNRLVPVPTTVLAADRIRADVAYFGAQYVLFVVDEAGNFAVADLPVTVRQPASDNTPPAITVSLPSSVTPGGDLSVSGTYSDLNPPPPPPPPRNNVQIFRSHGSLGGFEWYRAGPTSLDVTVTSGNYSTTITSGAPNYTGSLGVVVLGLDNFNNLGSATGTVDVRP